MNKQEFIRSLIGLNVNAAKLLIIENEYEFRTILENGIHYFGTTDLNLNRINLEIENEIVVRALWG